MKKLIAVIITFIFIFEGTGYCLRPTLNFSAQRKSPDYLCRMLAEYTGRSMRRSMVKNGAVNKQALDIGIIYPEFTPKRLLKESMSEENYNNLMIQIQENNINMDIDRQGNIWISYEPGNIYICIDKDGRYGYRLKTQFYDAIARKIELTGTGAKPNVPIAPIRKTALIANYPGEIIVHDRDGNKVELTIAGLLDKNNKETYFVIRSPNNNIRLVSFEYEDALRSLRPEELRDLFTRINSMHLQIAITSRSENLLNWLSGLIQRYPEINSCVGFCHVDRRGVNIKTIADEAHLEPHQIMHFSSTRAASMRTQGYVSIMVTSQERLSTSFNIQKLVMRKRIDAVVIGGKRINTIIELIERWTKVEEKNVPVKPAPVYYNGNVEQILVRNPEFETDTEVRGLLARIQANPGDLIARNMFGSACVRRNKDKEAIGACLDLLELISVRRIDSKGHTKGFLDKNEEIAMRTLVSAYHGIGNYVKAMNAAKNLTERFPKNIINTYLFMSNCIWAGSYDEGISVGEKAVEEYPDDTGIRKCLTTLYLDRALKKSMLGEENNSDMEKALGIAGLDEAFLGKHGLRLINGNERAKIPYQIEEHDIEIENVHTKEKCVLSGWSFNHILNEHAGEPREFGLNRTLFPAGIDNETIKELVIQAAKYGVNIRRSFPWSSGDILVWHVEDDDPVLAAKTGVSQMEIVISGGVIITGYPKMGEKIRFVDKNGYKLDKASVMIHASISPFIWNKDSRKRALLLAGDGSMDLSGGLASSIFGNMKRVWREFVIMHALWEGKFLGPEETRRAEVYKYEIPDKYIQEYNLPHSTIYVYLDVESRRLLRVTGQARVVNYIPRPLQDVADNVDVSRKPRAYSLAELREKHRIGGKGLSIDDLQERGYYYNETTRLFYDNEDAWRRAKKSEPLIPLAKKVKAPDSRPHEVLKTGMEISVPEPAPLVNTEVQVIEKPKEETVERIRLTEDQKIRLRKMIADNLHKQKYKDLEDELEILVNTIKEPSVQRFKVLSLVPRLNGFDEKAFKAIVKAVLKFKTQEAQRERELKNNEGAIEIIHPEKLDSLDLRAVVFDWDGTIDDAIWFWPEVEASVITGLGFNNEEAMTIVKETSGLSTLARMGVAISKAVDKGIAVTETAEELEIKAQEEIDRRAAIEKQSWNEKSPLIPGIKELLEALNINNIFCYVATADTGERKRRHAENLGLSKYFVNGGIYGGNDPGYTNKLTFLQKLMQGGLNPGQLIMIEDSPSGIKAAKEAGCLAVGLAKDSSSREDLINAGADIIINGNYSKLDKILEILKIKTVPNLLETVSHEALASI